jgi:hypothetical protein
MVKRYGDDAMLEAAQRADEMLEQGARGTLPCFAPAITSAACQGAVNPRLRLRGAGKLVCWAKERWPWNVGLPPAALPMLWDTAVLWREMRSALTQRFACAMRDY